MCVCFSNVLRQLFPQRAAFHEEIFKDNHLAVLCYLPL